MNITLSAVVIAALAVRGSKPKKSELTCGSAIAPPETKDINTEPTGTLDGVSTEQERSSVPLRSITRQSRKPTLR